MDKYFKLTEDHIKLLRRMWVGWCDAEYGAPEIDPKRPYGNSDVVTDIVEILGWDLVVRDDEGEYTETVSQLARILHLETETALQIVLQFGSFEPGEFVQPQYKYRWERVA